MGSFKNSLVLPGWKLFQKALVVAMALPGVAWAAPHPGAGSSLLVAPEAGLFWIRQGFQIQTRGSSWQLGAFSEDKNSEVRLLRPGSNSASLAIRNEDLKSEMTLENYSKRWMKDYSNYGFDLLGTQTFIQSGTKALVVDLLHKKTEQQMRQVLFLKNKKVVILTCKDDQKHFEKTLIECNQVSKSFQWAELSRQTAF